MSSTLIASTDNSFVKTQDDWLPTWPCEEPTAQQLEEYFKIATPLVTSRGHDYDVRGELPPSLLHLSQLHHMDGMTELSATQAGGIAAAQKHNMQIRKMIADNDQKTLQRAAVLAQQRNLFASAIILSLHRTAPIRLEALKAKHATGTDGVFDGTAMWKELLELTRHESDMQDLVDHDRFLEMMRDKPLPDGGSVQDYSLRINTLRRHHLPYLQRPFRDDAALAEFFIDLMPRANAAEGRAIKKELRAGGKMSSVNAVAECVKVVKASESTEVRKAAAAAFARHAGLAPPLAAGQQHQQIGAVATAAAAAAIGQMLQIPSMQNPQLSDQLIELNQIPPSGSNPSGASKKAAAKAAAAAAREAQTAAAASSATDADAAMLKHLKEAMAAITNKRKGDKGGKGGMEKLPDGRTCKQGTCPWPHEGDCWRAPSYAGPLPEPQCYNEKLVERLNADKVANSKKPGIKGQLVLLKVKVKPANSAAAHEATLAGDAAGDGVDSFSMWKPSNPAVIARQPVRDTGQSDYYGMPVYAPLETFVAQSIRCHRRRRRSRWQRAVGGGGRRSTAIADRRRRGRGRSLERRCIRDESAYRSRSCRPATRRVGQSRYSALTVGVRGDAI